MCLIIDANKTADFVNQPQHEDHRPIYRRIDRGLRVALGGRLLTEQYRIEKARRYFVELLRSGRALRYVDANVDAEEAEVTRSGLCKSDDPHVIALARVSGARVLFSEDQDLGTDFGNLELVPKPRGKVYKKAEHEPLLRNPPPCRRPDRRPPPPSRGR